MSAPVALAQLVMLGGDAATVRDAIERARPGPGEPPPVELSQRARALGALLPTLDAGCFRIGNIVREVSSVPPAAGAPESAIARTRSLFDRCVAESEEASVALYSLGSPELLAAASSELVQTLVRWGLLDPTREVLDLGCGIGRIAERVAPLVAGVWGMDISAAMIAAARRRCRALSNVRFSVSGGIDLPMCPDACVDLVLAIDTFPYVLEAGEGTAAALFREVRRVLRAGGDFVLVNYSYRGDAAADRGDVARLARAADLDVLVTGEAAFTLWDGVAYRLARRGEARAARAGSRPRS